MLKEIFIYLMYVSIFPTTWLLHQLLYLNTLPEYQSAAASALIAGCLAGLLKVKVEPHLRGAEQE
jgi:hypothetical protein